MEIKFKIPPGKLQHLKRWHLIMDAAVTPGLDTSRSQPAFYLDVIHGRHCYAMLQANSLLQVRIPRLSSTHKHNNYAKMCYLKDWYYARIVLQPHVVCPCITIGCITSWTLKWFYMRQTRAKKIVLWHPPRPQLQLLVKSLSAVVSADILVSCLLFFLLAIGFASAKIAVTRVLYNE